MKIETKKSGWNRFRKLMNTIHLWLGVGSGLILFVVCLTGTIYTFQPDIVKWIDHERYTVQSVENTQLSLEKIKTHVLDSLQKPRIQAVTIPENKFSTIQVTIPAEQKNEESGMGQGKGKSGNPSSGPVQSGAGGGKGGPGKGRGTTYLVNPYSGAVLGTTESTTSEFFMVVFRLHRWLLLDMSIGRPIVGVATIIFVFIILTGIIIWFPKKIKNWKQGLKIKTSANWKRINHDLHNSLGIYSSLLLLVMALTGLTWSFEWYKKGFNNVLGVSGQGQQNENKLVSVPDSTRQASLDEYLVAAKTALGSTGDFRINLPQDSFSTVSITRTYNGFFAISGSDQVQLDQYSAEVLKKELFSDKPLNKQIASSVKALHIGNIFGSFSKIIYFLGCLIATSLPVTGVLIWINKLRRKEDEKSRKEEEVEVED